MSSTYPKKPYFFSASIVYISSLTKVILTTLPKYVILYTLPNREKIEGRLKMNIEMSLPQSTLETETLTPGFLAVAYLDWYIIHESLCLKLQKHRTVMMAELEVQYERNIHEAHVKMNAYKEEFLRLYDYEAFSDLMCRLTGDPFFEE